MYLGKNDDGTFATLTDYQYGAATGRLNHIRTADSSDKVLQYNVYTYDAVDIHGGG